MLINLLQASAQNPVGSTPETLSLGSHVILGWNDLGMHCMQDGFADLVILPPYNNLWVEVIERGNPPRRITSDVKIEYRFPENTTSADKVDFWQYEDAIFGVELPDNVGLTGNGLTGELDWNGRGWEVTGVPITPYTDTEPTVEQPYQLAELTLKHEISGEFLDQTTIVAPVSTEMHCAKCHSEDEDDRPASKAITPTAVWDEILKEHDEEEGTNLLNNKPVLCASCHEDVALGTTGQPGVPSLSLAMHDKHADEVSSMSCYDCHPGDQTQCHRGAMRGAGLDCVDCHGTLREVANSIKQGRRPWLDEPRCGECHPGYEENPDTLYRESIGHGGLHCTTCHNSPHAILPSTQPRDNLQALRVQGRADTIKNCLVCHTQQPEGAGPHGVITSWRIANHVAKTRPLGGDELARADYNEDGIVDIADAVYQVERGM